MRQAFELAAFRAGCRAQRGGASYEENPFGHSRFTELARRWSRGWVTAIESAMPLHWLLWRDARDVDQHEEVA